MAVRFAITVSLGVSLFAAQAGAQPLERGALRLDWVAPGGCPNGVEVLERIETLLGGPIANLRPDPIAAKGTVRQLEPLRFELELSRRSA